MPKGSDARESGNGFLEQSEAFGNQFRAKKGSPCNISAWSGEADDQFIADRTGHAAHHDRDYAGCLFGCASWRRTDHDDDVNLEPNQIGRELLESICIRIPVASLDRYVQTLGVTELSQPIVKSNGSWHIGRAGIQHADKGELSLLLGVSGERPRGCRATDQCDELAPLHCQPQAQEMAS